MDVYNLPLPIIQPTKTRQQKPEFVYVGVKTLNPKNQDLYKWVCAISLAWLSLAFLVLVYKIDRCGHESFPLQIIQQTKKSQQKSKQQNKARNNRVNTETFLRTRFPPP